MRTSRLKRVFRNRTVDEIKEQCGKSEAEYTAKPKNILFYLRCGTQKRYSKWLHRNTKTSKTSKTSKCDEVGVVFIHNNEILLVNKAGWGFPGGNVEPNETCKEAAFRNFEKDVGSALDPSLFTSIKENSQFSYELLRTFNLM